VVRRAGGAVGLDRLGRSILAAQAMGADLAYIGSAFIATKEANAVQGYKDMIVESHADDILYSNLFTGVHGNYLRRRSSRRGWTRPTCRSAIRRP
jgi:NAD(P)H-dependent flavin oxidoreductase YrpB (nitropropane dioxygenase family)